jgi:hypothetical protein
MGAVSRPAFDVDFTDTSGLSMSSMHSVPDSCDGAVGRTRASEWRAS